MTLLQRVTKKIRILHVLHFCFALGLFFCFSTAISAQCNLVATTDTILSVSGNQDPTSSYLVTLGVKSDSGGTYQVALENLLLSHSNQVVDVPIEITPSTFEIAAGQSVKIPLKLKGFALSGEFTGMLQVSTSNRNCEALFIPLKVDIKPNLISIPAGEDEVEIMTVNRSLLYWLVPPRLRSKNLLVAVNNNGVTDVKITGQSLLLRGKETNQALTLEDLGLESQPFTLKAGERNILEFDLTKKGKFDPDQYSGTMELYLEGVAEPKTVEVDFYLRGGIFGAIIALALGLLLGFFVRDLKRNKVQVEWMNKILNFKLKLGTLSSESAKEFLRLELDEFESKLANASDEDVQKSLETEFASIQEKFEKIKTAENLAQRIKKADPGTDMQGSVDKIIKACANDDLNSAEKEMENLNTMLNDKLIGTTKLSERTATRGLRTRGTSPATEGTHGPSSESTKPTLWQRFLGFITNMPRLRFYVFRPVMYAALLILILLWGLQEIYLSDSSNTFGVGGVYDYVKLFGWGAASKVFSWQVIGKNLLGWQDTPATPVTPTTPAS